MPTKPAGLSAGTLLVGTDLQPGIYRSNNQGGGCYWARLRGLGGVTGDILANDNASGPALVAIAPTDKAFMSVRCAPWLSATGPITVSPTATFGEGTFMVNTDIAPGTWRSDGGDGCYWARLRSFAGGADAIIANNNAAGQAVVQIAPGDVGFKSVRCKPWTMIA